MYSMPVCTLTLLSQVLIVWCGGIGYRSLLQAPAAVVAAAVLRAVAVEDIGGLDVGPRLKRPLRQILHAESLTASLRAPALR